MTSPLLEEMWQVLGASGLAVLQFSHTAPQHYAHQGDIRRLTALAILQAGQAPN